ncbi:MAG: hypothetical protein HQ567_21635 [Candidatus Nealsonbacteria bacterium]|nr:hypothetical protein [Candidatus Nealsonbacteria bacterium]
MTDYFDVCLSVTGNPTNVREFVTSLWRQTQRGDADFTMIGDTDAILYQGDEHPIDDPKIEYDPYEDPYVARFSGSAMGEFPYFSLREESKKWPDLDFRCNFFRLRNGIEETLNHADFHFWSASPKYTPIHHWDINVETPVEKDVGLAIQERLQDEGIFISTAPGKPPLDFADTVSGRYMGVSRKSIDEITRWFYEHYSVRVRDKGSYAATLDELAYLRDIECGTWASGLETKFGNGQPVFSDQLRPFREILERQITLTGVEQAFVVAGLLRYGQDKFRRWNFCQQRLGMLIGKNLASSLWQQFDDKTPVDYEAISQRLTGVQWSQDCPPMGFELEQVLQGYGEHVGGPDRDERFKVVEKAMRSPQWTTRWPLWEIEMPS